MQVINTDEAIRSLKYAIWTITHTLEDSGLEAKNVPYNVGIRKIARSLYFLTGVMPIFILNQADPRYPRSEWCLNGEPIQVSGCSYFSFDPKTFEVVKFERPIEVTHGL